MDHALAQPLQTILNHLFDSSRALHLPFNEKAVTMTTSTTMIHPHSSVEFCFVTTNLVVNFFCRLIPLSHKLVKERITQSQFSYVNDSGTKVMASLIIIKDETRAKRVKSTASPAQRHTDEKRTRENTVRGMKINWGLPSTILSQLTFFQFRRFLVVTLANGNLSQFQFMNVSKSNNLSSPPFIQWLY